MNDTEIRERLRDARPVPVGAPDLEPVERRARVLRWRRAGAVIVSATLAAAAIAIPLSGLHHLGEASPSQPAAGPPAISFAGLDGWKSTTETSAVSAPFDEQQIEAITSNEPLSPPAESFSYPTVLTSDQIQNLSADGVAIEARQAVFTRNTVPTRDYPPMTLPLDLGSANVAHGPFEGLSREDVTSYTLAGTVNGRAISVQAWFGTGAPSDRTIRQAQQALETLEVVPAPAATTEIDEFGISMSVPQGWNALLYAGDPTLIVSTRPIERLYWDEARRSLAADDVTFTLDESQALVELEGWAPLDGPLSIGPYERCDGCEALDDGAPPAPGHVLYERTFSTGGRAFSLYVDFGSEPTASELDTVNAALATISIAPLPDATYTPAPGTTRVGPIYDGEDQPEVSATDQDRILNWAYEHARMTLPDGWTGQSSPVAGLERPISLLAAGSWNFTPGGYCGPINALRELPADGALVWMDGYGSTAPDGIAFEPQPTTVHVTGAETDASPCFAGADPYVFRWKIGDRFVVVHAALGPDASPRTIESAEAALESVSVG